MFFSLRRNATARLGGKEMIRSALASGRTAARQISATRPKFHARTVTAHACTKCTGAPSMPLVLRRTNLGGPSTGISVPARTRITMESATLHRLDRRRHAVRLERCSRARRGKELPRWVSHHKGAVGVALAPRRDAEFRWRLARHLGIRLVAPSVTS